MMFILLFGFISSAQACTYHLDQSTAYIADRSISFGDYLNQKMIAKGYTPVEVGTVPEFYLELTLSTLQQSHFEHAQSTVTLTHLKDNSVFSKVADTRCFTQNCAAKDGAKVIQKSIDDFGKDLPSCE